MIIGIVGPDVGEVQKFVQNTLAEKHIQVVDSGQILQHLQEEVLNSLMTQDYHKKYFLKNLESQLGTVVVTGNLLLNPNLCEWILENQGAVVIVPNKLAELDSSWDSRYWSQETVREYELEQRFNDLYKRLQKIHVDQLYMISPKQAQQIKIQNWSNSKIYGLDDQSLANYALGKGDENMNMEDSIRQAMKELGIELNQPAREVAPITLPIPEETQVNSSEISPETDQVLPFDEGKANTQAQQLTFPEFEEEEPALEEEDQQKSIFVKLTDTNMAILFPASLELDKRVIDGVEYNVVTVEIPDLNDRKLQELKSINNAPAVKAVQPTKQTQKPIKVDELIKTSSMEDLEAHLEALKQEKVRLDVEIKQNRAAGNLDTVNVLRKQRRAIRAKINKLS